MKKRPKRIRGVVLDPTSEIQLGYVLRKTYPNGPLWGGTEIGMTREMLTTTVNSLARILIEEDRPFRLALESTARATWDYRGLIIKTKKRTHTVPLTVSPFLIRIDGEPIFLRDEDGVTDLLDMIICKIETAAEAEKADR